MIAVKGGTFEMGSPESEAFHKADEGPILLQITMDSRFRKNIWLQLILFSPGLTGRIINFTLKTKNVQLLNFLFLSFFLNLKTRMK